MCRKPDFRSMDQKDQLRSDARCEALRTVRFPMTTKPLAWSHSSAYRVLSHFLFKRHPGTFCERPGAGRHTSAH